MGAALAAFCWLGRGKGRGGGSKRSPRPG